VRDGVGRRPERDDGLAVQALDDPPGAGDVQRPGEVGLDAAEHDEVVGAAGAHDLEVVGRPRHLAGLAVDELDVGRSWVKS
jgi:hypothetical protein